MAVSDRLQEIRAHLVDAGLRVGEAGSTKWPELPYVRVEYSGDTPSEFRDRYGIGVARVFGSRKNSQSDLDRMADTAAATAQALFTARGAFAIGTATAPYERDERIGGGQDVRFWCTDIRFRFTQ